MSWLSSFFSSFNWKVLAEGLAKALIAKVIEDARGKRDQWGNDHGAPLISKIESALGADVTPEEADMVKAALTAYTDAVISDLEQHLTAEADKIA